MRGLQIKRFLSLVLCIMMVVALLPMSTLADGAAASSDTQTTTDTASSDAAQSSDETGSTQTGSTGDASASTESTEADTQNSTASESDAAGDSNAATTTQETETTEEPVAETPSETASSYTGTFSVGGAIDASLTQTIAANATVDKPANPSVPEGTEYAGMSFLYWYATANTAYDFATPVTDSFTLYAKFGAANAADEDTDETTTDKTAEDPDAALEADASKELSVLEEDLLFSAMSVDGGFLPEDTYLWTYTFMVNDSAVDSQIIANGDTLYAPEAPAADAGMKFVGWYDESNTLFTSFGTQSVSMNGATTLSARFETAYYVFFHNQYGSIIETRTPDSSNLVATSGISALQLASNQALMGWATTQGGTSDVGASVTVNKANIDLYPIIQDVIWITFDSTGGTYIAPTYIVPGVALTQEYINSYVASQNSNSSTITKVGYAFSGWSGFTFGTVPTANITLTAGWTAQSVGYTVLFWQQAVVGDDYNFVSSYTVTNRTATAGSTVSPLAADTQKTDKGFTYNATKSVAVTVKGDGSTILNVYYDRQTWTINFLMKTKNNNNAYSNNGTYFTWVTKDGRYGAKIGYWPITSEITGYYSGGMGNYTFTGWRQNAANYGTMLSYLEIFDDGGTTLFYSGVLNLYAQYENGSITTDTFNHYCQNLDGSYPTSPSLTAYGYNVGSFNVNNRFVGFTAAYYNTNTNNTWQSATPGSTTVDLNWINTVNIRHTRNSYNLTVRNFNTQLSSTSVLYEKSLSTYQPAQPSRPSGIPADYVWAGWYTTQAGYAGSEVNWSITMPANDLIIYGVWKAPSFTGIAHSVSFGSAGGTSVDLGDIVYGGTISAEALLAAQNAAIADKPHDTDIFGGWYIMKNGSLILFNASMRIYENVVLYPVWISGLTYTVTYSLGDAEGTAPVDTAAYGVGAQAQVLAYNASLVTAPAGKRFIGWLSSADGKLYYANSAITVSANTTLTAQWSAASTYIDITYDGNGGTLPGGGTADVVSVLNNTTHTIRYNTFIYTGKLFTGWNTEPDGSGTSYSPEASVLVGASISTAPSTLYAQWEDQTFTVSVTANPAVGVTTKSGAGSYIYNSDATIAWTLTNGYEISSVTDNETTIPAEQYADNQYTLTGVVKDHAIVINTVLTLFTLTYNGNGGTYNSSGSYDSIKTVGTSFTVDTNKFTREGYYFLGWSTNAGATEAELAYAPNSSKRMPADDLTLYAVWAEKRPLTLTAASAVIAYDGTEKSVSGILSSESGLTIEGTTAGAIGTEPGVYPTSFTNQTGLVLKSGETDVTEQYIVDWKDGNLTVNPVVTYINSATGGVIGSEAVAYGTGSATYNVTLPQNVTVGTTNFYWTGTFNPAEATNLTQNTTITAVYSQNKTLVITAGSDTRVYTGDTQSVTTATLSDTDLTVTGYSVLGSGINVDTYPVTVTLGTVKIMSGEDDVTYQYDVSTVPGVLTITPAKMTATVSGYNAKYDGNAYGITVTPDMPDSTVLYGTAEGEYTLPSSPTATNVDDSMTVYYVVTNPNYESLYGSADVVIQKREIKLTTEDATKAYDTFALTNAAYSLDPDSDAFVEGQGFDTAGGIGTITDVGTKANGFAYTLKTGTLAQNYAISVTEGELEVTPASGMTVSADSYSTLYDGDGYGVVATASIPDSTIRYSTSYSDDPADYTSSLSPEQIHAGSLTVYFLATNDNYLPARGSATVTVTPRQINILTSSASKVYDGTPLTSTGWSVDSASDGFAGSDGFSLATTNGSITTVGTADNGFGYTLKAGTQSTDYVITTTPGKLTVDLRTVLIAADDVQKNYGAADPAFTYHFETGTIGGVTFYGLTPADTGAFTIGVDRTNTAENVGVYSDVLKVTVSADASVSANYDIYLATGSFTINPQVTYSLNTTDGVTGFPGTQWFSYGEDASIAGNSGVFRPGYHLIGWEDITTGATYLLGEAIPAIDRNYSFRAIWELALYNVYYVRGTGDNVESVPDDALELKYGTTYVISSGVPYRSGYSFLYWMTSDVTGTERTYVGGDLISIPDNNVKLTAVWFAEESPVYYHSNFGADEKTEGGSFATDSIATVAGNMFSRPGYRFIGWSEKSATASVSRQPGNTFAMPPRQVNFYAQWQQEFYSVTYYVNGGTGKGMDGATPYVTYTNLAYGDAMPKPADPTLVGFTFTGWSTPIPATVPDGGLVIYGSLSPSSASTSVVENIDDSRTPLAGGPTWALLNLVIAVATALTSLLMLIGYFGKKKQIEDGRVVRETKKHGGVRLTTLLPGIGGIVAFILTENMKNPMVFVDRWTILMIIIAAILLLLVMLGIKQDKEPDDSSSSDATRA